MNSEDRGGFLKHLWFKDLGERAIDSRKLGLSSAFCTHSNKYSHCHSIQIEFCDSSG
jgi:hypothetical protein